MKAKTLQVNWHDRMPIFCAAFAPPQLSSRVQTFSRLATAGGDQNIRVHGTLASGGDDGTLILWHQVAKNETNTSLDEDSDNKENWKILQILRGCSADIYDIIWSPRGTHIMAGCVDNSARIWDVKENRCIHVLTEHMNFVQGVAWDPLDEFIASQSSDRSMNIYQLLRNQTDSTLGVKYFSKQSKVTVSLKTSKVTGVSSGIATDIFCLSDEEKNISQAEQSGISTHKKAKIDSVATASTYSANRQSATTVKIFFDENLPSFFRRLSFSPDGSLLVTPAGIYRGNTKDVTANVVYLFTRENMKGEPIARLSGFKKPAIAVRFNPILYDLKPNEEKYVGQQIVLPYRMIFAVASQDSVVIYDTSRLTRPTAVISNLHYGTLTDISWSHDGNMLIMSSTDGYCSMVTFAISEIGSPQVICKIQAKRQVGAEAHILTESSTAKTVEINVLNSALIKKKKIAETVPSVSSNPPELENYFPKG
ncbi:hypothetical protein HK100_006456 [Physocladia obscura]|uniref:CAF1B/HIR1 beta-propeller domain-containing protein n=1 Tax=Physocladia obscura TaxID=109957 RepID=A0AAD5XKZ0_9FUNG|nr:hypothetical protein HK100_006456 [Physocladia obscura]